jgi:hypothetical protein
MYFHLYVLRVLLLVMLPLVSSNFLVFDGVSLSDPLFPFFVNCSLRSKDGPSIKSVLQVTCFP